MFDLFDEIYCISLPDDNRRKAMLAQFEVLGISAKFVHAKKPPASFTMSNMRRNPRMEFGCSLSHVAAIVEAMKDGAERPLFLEDDIIFPRDPFGPLVKVSKALPCGWDVLYFGGHPREKVTRVADGLVSVGKFSCAEAYAVRGSRLPDLLKFWLDRVSQPNAMWDFVLGEFAAENKAFCAYPCITEQAQVRSHISERVDDKRELIKRGWANNLQ